MYKYKFLNSDKCDILMKAVNTSNTRYDIVYIGTLYYLFTFSVNLFWKKMLFKSKKNTTSLYMFFKSNPGHFNRSYTW